MDRMLVGDLAFALLSKLPLLRKNISNKPMLLKLAPAYNGTRRNGASRTF
jgi:hypothetical protein